MNQNRNLETDFWIFLVASYFLKVLQLKNFFKDTSKLNQNKSLSKEEIVTGTYLIRGLRVRIFFYRDQLIYERKIAPFSYYSFIAAISLAYFC